MRVVTFTALGCLLLVAASGCSVDKEKLPGKWELTEGAAGMPAGTIWEFTKDGKLIIHVMGISKGGTSWSVSGTMLNLDFGNKKDKTKIQTLTDTELILKDSDGTTAKFKRVAADPAPRQK